MVSPVQEQSQQRARGVGLVVPPVGDVPVYAAPEETGVKPLWDNVVVQMLPQPDNKFGILTVESATHPLCDCGLVVESAVDWVKKGDTVLVWPYAGKKVADFSTDKWEAATQVRFYGNQGGKMLDYMVGDPMSVPEKVPCERQILMVLTENVWKPTKNNVLVRLRGLEDTTAGGVLLPLSAQTRECKCELLSKGSYCTVEAEPGDKVIIWEGYLRDEGQRIGDTWDFIVPESAVMAVLPA